MGIKLHRRRGGVGYSVGSIMKSGLFFWTDHALSFVLQSIRLGFTASILEAFGAIFL